MSHKRFLCSDLQNSQKRLLFKFSYLFLYEDTVINK